MGCSMPMESLYMQQKAHTLREELGLPLVSRDSLTWPAEFTPPMAALPFQHDFEDVIVLHNF